MAPKHANILPETLCIVLNWGVICRWSNQAATDDRSRSQVGLSIEFSWMDEGWIVHILENFCVSDESSMDIWVGGFTSRSVVAYSATSTIRVIHSFEWIEIVVVALLLLVIHVLSLWEKSVMILVAQYPVCINFALFELVRLEHVGAFGYLWGEKALGRLKALIKLAKLILALLLNKSFLFLDTLEFFAAKVIVRVLKVLNEATSATVLNRHSDNSLRILDSWEAQRNKLVISRDHLFRWFIEQIFYNWRFLSVFESILLSFEAPIEEIIVWE